MKKYLFLLIPLLLCSCETRIESPKEIVIPKTENTLSYNRTQFEYGEYVKLSKIIKNKDITYDDIYLPMNDLGENEYTIFYEKDDVKYQEVYSYVIKDTTAPILHLAGSYSVAKGYQKELAKAIPCIDNFDKNPKCYIEGNYDVNRVGSYRLKYIAEDSSGNKNEINFTLYVNNPSKTTYSTHRTKIENVINKYKNDNTMIGIDVSKWQEDIDWAKVKESGIEFAIIRIGTQKTFNTDEIVEDAYFTKNIEGALANDIKVGLYIYSYATTDKEAIDQAKYIIDKVKNYKIEMPIAWDWESYGSITGKGMSLTDFRNHGYRFIEELENAGYHGILYGSKNYLNKFWQPIQADTWLAHYTYNLNRSDYDRNYIMWQLCNDGKVNGINGAVDIDIYYK